MSSKNFSKAKYLKKFVLLLATVGSINLASISPVLANPQGGSVTSGSATISSSGNTTTINQSSQQAILHWNSFNISKGETTQFVQPNSSSVALNRINPSQGASQIFGQLNANGQLILINAAGINFSSGSSVNVASLIASTSDITDSNFLAGKYVFDQASTFSKATITNAGRIIAANNGLVALLGSNVVNNGYIQAEMGNVVIGAGKTFTLSFNGDQLINFTVDSGVANAKVSNTGTLLADAGKVLVTARTASSVLDNVIDMKGIVQANSVTQQNGEIILSANGGVSVSGKLSAKGSAAGTSGGTVQISANYLTTAASSVIDTGGDAGAGNIAVAANSMYLGGAINAIGTGTSAVGGNVQLTSDAIELGLGASVNASGTTGGGTVNFTAATFAPTSFAQLDRGSSVQANALSSGTGGTVSFNTGTTSLSNSFVNASGYGTGSFGGVINVSSNVINISQGSTLMSNGDFLGGSVTLSGMNASGSSFGNAALINLDSFSQILANATGSDGVIGGFVNLYANNAFLAGQIITTDASQLGIGGDIGIFGQNLYIQPGAVISANANYLGGEVSIGGNPYSTTSDTNSANVIVNPFSYIGASATGLAGTDGFGGSINVSADNVVIAGELDVSGNANPYLTYSLSSTGNSGGNSFCGFGGGNNGHLVSTVNNSGSSAGSINVTGNNISVLAGGYLNAAGNVFGGEINLGSNPSAGPATTSNIFLGAGSLLDAGAYGTTGNPIGGIIQLFANNTTVNGAINASGSAGSGSLAGEVKILAQNTVTVGTLASIVANGDTDGGEILIGGDLDGAGTDPNAQFTNVGPLAYISASALTNGIGGEVVVWSNTATNFAASSIYAQGGAQGGNGGQVEVSGAGKVSYSGYINVNAPKGTKGTYNVGGTSYDNSTTTTAGNTGGSHGSSGTQGGGGLAGNILSFLASLF